MCTGGMERESCVRGKHEQLKEPLLFGTEHMGAVYVPETKGF